MRHLCLFAERAIQGHEFRGEEMTTEEALAFLDGLCAKAVVNRETHERIKEAFAKLRLDLKVCLEDLPSLPAGVIPHFPEVQE